MNNYKTTVSSIDGDLTFVDDRMEIEHVLDSIGYDDKGIFNGLFVGSEDGEYTEAYGTRSSIPWAHSDAYIVLAEEAH